MSGRTTRVLLPWVLRALWAALPFTAGPALAAALHGDSHPVRALASVGLWAGWGVGLIATVVPHPIGLTTIRVLTPAAVGAAIAAGIGHGQRGRGALAVGWSAVATAWTFAPTTGAWCVNGPAYPNERRHLLRAPGPLLAGPLVLAWAIAVGGLSAGPLLLAAERWVPGAIVTVIGLPVAVLLLRSLHGLSRRWAVFVPAGLVLHDPVTLTDSALFRRQSVRALQPARPGSDGLDVSQRAPGLALELQLVEPVDVGLLHPGRRQGDTRRADRLLFTPTRPGQVLDDARARRFPVP